MAVVDTRREQLTVLGRTGAPAAAVAAALRVLDAREAIERERYAPERAREELQEASAAAAEELRAVVAETEAGIDRETLAALRDHDRARVAAAAEKRELRDVVDLDHLRETDDVSELLDMVRTADAAGETVGHEARRRVEERLRALATLEQRKHIIGGRAFRALCSCSLGTSPRGGSRTDIEARAEGRKKAARSLVLQVAHIVGLGAQLAEALKRAAVGTPTTNDNAPPRSAPVFGSYWERQAAARRG